MAIEVLDPKTEIATQPREVRREDFGPGNAGEWAFQTILSGVLCVTFIDGNETICGQTAVGTVDIDVRDDLEFFPFCSPKHQRLVQSQVLDQLHEQGRYSIPSVNGFGRSIPSSRITSPDLEI